MKDDKIKISVGIPSYNEKRNIINLLDEIKKQELYGVAEIDEIIISDDSDDDTPRMIEKYVEEGGSYGDRIMLIHHEGRRGVANAWNEIFRVADGDIVVLYDADIILTESTTYNLIKKIFRDGEVGLVGGNTIGIVGKGIASEASYFISRWLDIVRATYPESQFTIMGRGLAMRGKLAKKIVIPINVISVDLYVQCIAYREGYRVAYARDALIFFKPTKDIYEHVSQILRAVIGHRQLEDMVDKHIPCNLGLGKQIRLFIEASKRVERKFLYSTIVSYLIGMIYIPRVWRGANRYLWEIAKTTK